MYRAPREGAQQAFSSHLAIVPSVALSFCDFLPCPDWVKYDLKKILMDPPPMKDSAAVACPSPRQTVMQASYLARVMWHIFPVFGGSGHSDQHTTVLHVPLGTVCVHFKLSFCIKLCLQDAWHCCSPLSYFLCFLSIKTREICHPALLERNLPTPNITLDLPRVRRVSSLHHGKRIIYL